MAKRRATRSRKAAKTSKSKRTSASKSKRSPKIRKSRKSKGTRKAKRPLNKFFKMMMDAKKRNLPSFQYNGKSYTQRSKNGMIFYKAK